ncbi:unnamed protein product [Prorocentrum cordatum]|uniref:Uncharacterized protein n=1 Tax=Prorocentrum cordatum TaxID=2364126 RepID=A0ABN9VEN5_9DINO|nr:unnamed protein product [Polarella glacialis]
MCDGVLRREGAPSEEKGEKIPRGRTSSSLRPRWPGPAAGRPGAPRPPTAPASRRAWRRPRPARRIGQREKKRLKRLKELRRKNGEQVSSSDDEWYQDLLRKANARPKAAP